MVSLSIQGYPIMFFYHQLQWSCHILTKAWHWGEIDARLLCWYPQTIVHASGHMRRQLLPYVVPPRYGSCCLCLYLWIRLCIFPYSGPICLCCSTFPSRLNPTGSRRVARMWLSHAHTLKGMREDIFHRIHVQRQLCGRMCAMLKYPN